MAKFRRKIKRNVKKTKPLNIARNTKGNTKKLSSFEMKKSKTSTPKIETFTRQNKKGFNFKNQEIKSSRFSFLKELNEQVRLKSQRNQTRKELNKFNKENKTSIKIRTEQEIADFNRVRERDGLELTNIQRKEIYRENYLIVLSQNTTVEEFKNISNSIFKITPTQFYKEAQRNDNLTIEFMYVEEKRQAMINYLKKEWARIATMYENKRKKRKKPNRRKKK